MHVRHEALFRWLVERFPAPGSTAPTTTAAARTTSGWPAAGRSCSDVLPCSRRSFTPGSTVTRPSGCGRCASATPPSSSASAARLRSMSRAGDGARRAIDAGLDAPRRLATACRARRAERRSAASRTLLVARPDGPDGGPRARAGARRPSRRLPRRARARAVRAAPAIADLGLGRRLARPAAGDRAARARGHAGREQRAQVRASSSARGAPAGWRTSTVVHARAEELDGRASAASTS